MTKMRDINEDEIRVVGGAVRGGGKLRAVRWLLVAAIALVALLAVLLIMRQHPQQQVLPDPTAGAERVTETADTWLDNSDASLAVATTIRDTMIDSMHLQIYTPYNATAELYVGSMGDDDPDIILAAQAADLRRDNGKIVGAFVLAGEPLSWGLSKKGYCTIIDGRLTIGMAENSPLFEQATEQGGYFFRQYPSVSSGAMVGNNPENAACRRALCNLDGRVCIIGCTDRVLMNDFSSALVRLGVRDAIFLVGGTADGWCRDAEGNVVRIGIAAAKNKKYTNYIVFRRQ